MLYNFDLNIFKNVKERAVNSQACNILCHMIQKKAIYIIFSLRDTDVLNFLIFRKVNSYCLIPIR